MDGLLTRENLLHRIAYPPRGVRKTYPVVSWLASVSDNTFVVLGVGVLVPVTTGCLILLVYVQTILEKFIGG